jgi:hypothetical protein
VTSTAAQSARETVQQEVDAAVAQGFAPIDEDDHAMLTIEYAVDGMGTPADLDKRHRLEDRMDDTLGWTGLGACDGGSIGSGTMEVCAFVVDAALARQVIEAALAGTAFSDYTRIHLEPAA